ncbi:MAG TPA: VWA domain-containing protein, partial [Anaeromyxobacteraceae bacterium]|nr:VWA domain-containing protein [Anaeromyxobacteraceae bacterium]
MEARLVEFARVLRQNGVRVSPAEVADAARAAALVGLAEREAFRGALRSTLVKRAADVAIFDRLFDLYFSGLGRVLDGLERSLVGALEESGLSGDDLAAVAAALRQLAGQLSPLARAALAGDAAEVGRLLRAAALQIDFSALQSPTQLGFYGRRLLAAGGGGGLGAEMAALERALAERGLDPRILELVSERLALALRAVEEAARRWAELEQRARAAWRRDSFAARSLASLTRDEIARTETAVRRLAERLKARLVKRERSRRRGTLSVRRTLRRNLGVGGVPARLAFRHRRPERPDVVVLCYVSDSVRHVSRMMLLFLYTLQSLFTRVRSFVFVSDLGEVTEAFRAERDVSRAADLATAGKAVSLAGNSNYGRALRIFHRDFAGSVTRRTT